MKIEVGKFYMCANGEIIKIIKASSVDEYFGAIM